MTQLRPSVAQIPFDAARFEALRRAYVAGELSASRGVLPQAPQAPLPEEIDHGGGPDLRERGLAAIRAGKVAAVILNGGMAMRFGGGAKGVETLLDGRDDTFLSARLGALASLARRARAEVPVAVMHSFATQARSEAYLSAIDWAGVRLDARSSFVQSILPRIMADDGRPLYEHPLAAQLADTDLYAAPGHGDTLRRLAESGTLARLRERGVEHILFGNVDNLAATLDPEILGRHLQACDQGAQVSVEVVERLPTDTGGVMARVDGHAAIVEGIRLPKDCDLSPYHWFNTNTLWCSAELLAAPLELRWLAVERSLALPDGSRIQIVQFEQLIGQLSELAPTRLLAVDRRARFLPIKTRDDLASSADRIAELLANDDPQGTVARDRKGD